MPANEPTWTIERVELLKKCFEAGLSCRQIAGDIGVSRNAVIGKLSRLNLRRDTRPDRPPRPPRKDASAKRSRPQTMSRLRYQLRILCAEPTPAAEGEPIHNGHCCSLIELSDERCRWPISTPGAADFCFCGNLPVEGLPYCPGHTRLAYRIPAGRRTSG